MARRLYWRKSKKNKMARGRYLSLGEPRKSGKLYRFAKEHLSNGNWKRFDRMFASMVRRRLRESGEQSAKHQMRSLPKVISILKLFHILLKMLPRHVNMRPQDRQFQTNPKPLKAVDVAVAIQIFTCPMVDRLMGITRLVQPPSIGSQFVSVYDAPMFNVSGHDRLKNPLAHV